MWIHDMFGADKSTITLLRLDALPRNPESCGDVNVVPDHTAHDLMVLQSEGVDGTLTTNELSLPYQPVVDIAVISAIAYIIGELKNRIRIPSGVSAVKSPTATTDLAAVTGARFGRSCLSGVYMGEYGVYISNSGRAIRYRKALGMGHLKLLFKVNPEADVYPVQRDIQVVARSIMFGDFVNNLRVSGTTAGTEPDDVILSGVREAAKQKNVPVFCNTGRDHQSVREKLKHCDAVCIGSAFKEDGIFSQRANGKRVRDFMEIVKEAYGES